MGDAPFDPYDYGDTYSTIFEIGPNYSGTSFLGQTTTSSSIVPGPRLYNIVIDGGSSPPGVHGIEIVGHISDLMLFNVILSRLTGCGLVTRPNAGKIPLTARFGTVRARQCAGGGFQFNVLTDSHGVDMAARGCGADGIILGFCANSYFDMRAEFSGRNGFSLRSQGGYTLRCSTDRNARSGVAVTGTGPFAGSAPVVLYCDNLRRDASSGSGSGLAVIGAVTPVIVKSLNVYTGVNDNGSGLNSPVTGVTIQDAHHVQLPSGAYVQAASTPFEILGANTYLDIDQSAIITGTGTNAGSPGRPGAPAFAASWENLTDADLAGGWAIGGYARYRQEGRYLVFDFDRLVPPDPAPGDGTAIIESRLIPSHLRPARNHTAPAWASGVTGTTTAMAGVRYLTSGGMEIFGIGGSAVTGLSATLRFPLD